jgi:hypothetical protein
LPQSGHPGIVTEALRYRERVMGGCSSQSVTRSLVIALVAVLVACSGGSGGGQKASPKTSPPTSSNPPPTIDLSKPIPGGSLHGTPRPPLENTGTDYVAITRSLIGNLRWISENPDPSLISIVFVPGTPGHDERAAAYRYLVENGYRWADEGYRLISVDVVDVKPEVVSIRLTQELAFERIVDAAGNQVGQVRRHAGPETLNYVLAQSDGGWRIAGGNTGSPEVQL